jgi:hypothetical protein
MSQAAIEEVRVRVRELRIKMNQLLQAATLTELALQSLQAIDPTSDQETNAKLEKLETDTMKLVEDLKLNLQTNLKRIGKSMKKEVAPPVPGASKSSKGDKKAQPPVYDVGAR